MLEIALFASRCSVAGRDLPKYRILITGITIKNQLEYDYRWDDNPFVILDVVMEMG